MKVFGDSFAYEVKKVLSKIILTFGILKKSHAQSCLTLCDPVDYTVHGIQTRILEWVAFPFSRESSQPRVRTQASHIAGGFFTS